MLIKIKNGTEVDLLIGMTVVVSADLKGESFKATIVGFDQNFPLISFKDESFAISGDLIEGLSLADEPIESVDLGGGNVVSVSQSAALIIKAMLKTEAALQAEIEALKSGGAVEALLAENAKLKLKISDALVQSQNLTNLLGA